MDWTDDAIVLGSRPYGESKAIAELFVRGHGRMAGIVHGGGGRRAGAALQPGNLVRAGWRGRLAEQLGFFSPLELATAYAARALADEAALAGLSSAIALVRAGAAERQPYPALFDALTLLLEALDAADVWPAVYTRFELGLLSALGYGLDLSGCALTGGEGPLAWVSPKTGRAASFEAGQAFADRLLRLPPYLADPAAPLADGDVADGFALAGFFLERCLFDALGVGLPPARRRLIEALGRLGRL